MPNFQPLLLMAQKFVFSKESTVKISSKSISSNSFIFSFFSYFGRYWPQKNFQKIWNFVYRIFLWRPLRYYVEKKVRVTARSIWAQMLHIYLNVQLIFTFSSQTEYVKKKSNVIARVKKKFSPFDKCSCFVCLRRQNKQINFRLSVWMSVRTYVRGLFMWTQ